MDKRDFIKTLPAGLVGIATVATGGACATANDEPGPMGQGWVVIGYSLTPRSERNINEPPFDLVRKRFPMPIDPQDAILAFTAALNECRGDLRFIYFGVDEPEKEFDVSTSRGTAARAVMYGVGIDRWDQKGDQL